MSGGIGPRLLPSPLVRAAAILEKIGAWSKRDDLPFGADTALIEVRTVITSLMDHAQAEYKRGERNGRNGAWAAIRQKLDPDEPVNILIQEPKP